MRLRILGTRGEIDESAPGHRNHSGVLVDNTLLLDVGEKEFLSLKPEQILITHLHPDHAFFIVEPGEIGVPVYAPESYHNSVTVKALPQELVSGGFRVRPVPTHHSKKVRSSAFVVEDESARICYTGDVIWINKEFHPILKGSDLIITDGSYLRKGGMVIRDPETGLLFGHNGIPDLIRLFRNLTNHLLFVHFGSWFFKDISASKKKLEELGIENGMDILVGYDGMELDTQDLKI